MPRLDRSTVQPASKAAQRLAVSEPPEQFGDDHSLVGDEVPVRGVAGEPDTQRGLAALRPLHRRGPLTRGLALDLGPGDSQLDPGEQPPAVGAQIGLAVRGDDH